MKNNIFTKSITVILCFAMLLSMFSVTGKSGSDDGELLIYSNGVPVNELSFEENEKITLTANYAKDCDSYKWQIYADDAWVDIYGENGVTLEVSYPLVSEVLDENNTSHIRCEALDAEGNVSAISKEVNIRTYLLPTDDFSSGVKIKKGVVTKKLKAPLSADYCIITIEYIRWNDIESERVGAFPSYIATAEKGSNFSLNVKHPDIIGYKPMMYNAKGELVDSTAVEDTINNVSENKTYTVFYMPLPVNYTVHVAVQNTLNDEYTVAKTYKEVGNTDALTDNDGVMEKFLAEPGNEGFYALPSDPIVIAADGTTELTIYADRSYFLTRFILGDNAYGTESVYARVGTKFNVSKPTRWGWNFAGWKDLGKDYDDPKDDVNYTVDATGVLKNYEVKAYNTRVEAQWELTSTHYNIIYWKENADDDEYSYWGTEQKNATTGDKVSGADTIPNSIAGSDRAYFTFNNEKTDKDVVVNGDGSTIVNVYYKRNTYTITFRATGLCVLEKHTHSASCLGCGYTEHEHTRACYDFGKYDISTTPVDEWRTPRKNRTTKNGIDVYTYGLFTTHYCVRIGTNYYDVNNYDSDFDGVLSCDKVPHLHGDSCYTCGKQEHTHTQACDRATSENVVYVLTEKYGANILAVWEDDGFIGKNYSGNKWSSSRNTSYFYTFLEKMPSYDLTLTAEDGGSNKKTWYYYLEILPGQSTAGLKTKEYNGKTYYLYHTASIGGISRLTYEEDYFDIDGFTQLYNSSTWSSSFTNNEAFLYYTRNSYKLDFMNYNSTVVAKADTLLYEQALKDESFTPEYPKTLEEGAYEFAGWYSTEQCFEGTEVDFSKKKMPADNLCLYAKYVPVTHNVYLYIDSDTDDSSKLITSDMVENPVFDDGTEHTFNPTYPIVVDHGADLSDSLPYSIKKDGLQLAGWFYIENGVKKGYYPTMPITHDMKIFAEWNSNTVVKYKITYMLNNGDGTYTEIAKAKEGSAPANRGITFDAKYDVEWYDGYRHERYYPETNSHTVFMDPTKELVEYMFVYNEVKGPVYYSVYYLDAVSKVPVADPDIKLDTEETRVHPKFKFVNGYVPDAIQKSLTLVWTGNAESDAKANTVTFYYTAGDMTGYDIHYYYEDLDTTNFIEGSNSVFQPTMKDSSVGTSEFAQYIENGKFVGFELDHLDIDGTKATQAEAAEYKVDEDGTVFNVYYKRKLYKYTVKMLEFGTEKSIATENEVPNNKYMKHIKVTVPTAPDGYEAVTATDSEFDITEDKEVVFYYKQYEAEIRYVRVVPDFVSNKNVPLGDSDDSTIGVLSVAADYVTAIDGKPTDLAKTAPSSTATALDGYKLEGWFTDAACTTPVDTDWLSDDGATINPEKTDDVFPKKTTYYALFAADGLKLTVGHKELLEGETDFGQTFIYHIVSKGTGDVDIYVTVEQGKTVDIVGIPAGEYTVTEESKWSWRYEAPESKDVKAMPGAEPVIFESKQTNKNWLSCEDTKPNDFN